MITQFKLFENIQDWRKVGDYYGYKRYLGFPPIIVKILSIREVQAQIGKKYKYFVELLEEPHTTYDLDSWELEELDDDGKKELEIGACDKDC